MTRKAQALGMGQTVFANASGLPDPAQVTTARDLAILARALIADYPDRFDLFSRRYVAFGQGSQPTLNGWLGAYKGAEGMKTGFTRSEEHTSELQSLMRISYAVFCLKKKI